MSVSTVMEAIQSVNCVEAVDAITRIPEAYRKQSFFGFYDIWKYIPKFDRKLCPKCLQNATEVYYVGTFLRGLFPYLEIIDENTIAVNEHPHCRCILTRVTDPLEYLMITRELF